VAGRHGAGGSWGLAGDSHTREQMLRCMQGAPGIVKHTGRAAVMLHTTRHHTPLTLVHLAKCPCTQQQTYSRGQGSMSEGQDDSHEGDGCGHACQRHAGSTFILLHDAFQLARCSALLAASMVWALFYQVSTVQAACTACVQHAVRCRTHQAVCVARPRWMPWAGQPACP
jgi:hypothetical protein